jgi:hypothetical protein
MGLIKAVIVFIIGLAFLGYIDKKRNSWVKKFPLIEKYKAFLLLIIICLLLLLF